MDATEQQTQGVEQPELLGLKPGIQLYPHQENAVVRFLQNNDRIFLAHGTGTGKTLTAISTALAAKELGKAHRILVVTPTSLRTNFVENLKKFTNGVRFQLYGRENTKIDPDSEFLVVGYNYFIRHKDEIEQQYHPDMLMVDEFHHARNPRSSLFKALWDVRQHVSSFVGMTGSILNNKPEELVPLVSMVEGSKVGTITEFKRKYTQYLSEVRNPFGGSKKFEGFTKADATAKAIAPAVSYLSTEQLHGLPKKIVITKRVPMSDEQWDAYKYAMKQLGPVAKLLSSRRYSETLPSQKLNTIFGRLITVRKLSNSVADLHPNEDRGTAALQTPKIQTMMNDIVDNLMKNPNAKVVVYSNLVNGGVADVAAAAKKLGIKAGVFAGAGNVINGQKITTETRNKAVEDFKKGKLRMLILSPAGSEGISLPDASDLYMLDMHFNPQMILQAEARIRRIDSKHPKVTIHEYFSTKPKRLFSFMDRTPSVDEWVHDVAMAKYKGMAPIYTSLSRMSKLKSHPRLKEAMKFYLQKNPNTKYEKRWRDSSGNIRYKYNKDLPKASPRTTFSVKNLPQQKVI
jgi:superfamily II DNA or RNA helicase